MTEYVCRCGGTLRLVERLDEVDGASTFRLACVRSGCGFASIPVALAQPVTARLMQRLPAWIFALTPRDERGHRAFGRRERVSAPGGGPVVSPCSRFAIGRGGEAPVPNQSNAAD